MANVNTGINIGVRRHIDTLSDHRNYEPVGGAQYASNVDNLEYAGTKYATGATIPYDSSATGSAPYDRYKDDALMERYFNAGMVYPLT